MLVAAAVARSVDLGPVRIARRGSSDKDLDGSPALAPTAPGCFHALPPAPAPVDVDFDVG